MNNDHTLTIKYREATIRSQYNTRAFCSCGYKTNWHFIGHVEDLMARHLEREGAR